MEFRARGFGGGTLALDRHELLHERHLAQVEQLAGLVQLPAGVAGVPPVAKLDVNPLARLARLAAEFVRAWRGG